MKFASALCLLLIYNLVNGLYFPYEIPCGVTKYKKTERIVGGIIAKPNEFPWIVSIQIFDEEQDRFVHTCAGTIIHASYILTAGRCVELIKPEKLLIIAGKNNLAENEEHEQKRSVEIIYSKYVSSTYQHDIALVKLKEPLQLEPMYVNPGCLPYPNETYRAHAVAAGWGKTEDGKASDELKKVDLLLKDSQFCNKSYEDLGYQILLRDCQICTYDSDHRDVCQGDTGGPLMCTEQSTGKQIICGLIWGIGDCREDRPSINIEVLCYMQWIFNIMLYQGYYED